jgi:Xaa-Pro aminopeptidase
MTDATTHSTEFDAKQTRIAALLAAHDLDALLIQRVSSFAWATCGAASYINTATTNGVASLLITPTGRYVIADNIEATRLKQEEQLDAQDWEFHIAPWYETHDTIAELARGLKLAADNPYPNAIDLAQDIARMRAALTPEEGERYRALSRLCAEAMDHAIRAVRPGLTEYEIAALLSGEVQRQGVTPIVNLVATDERIFKFRHPLPTDKQLERYAMLVVCGRKWGLVCSITRLVYFGRLPTELGHKAEAVARIDAAFIAATRPGQTLGEIFRQAIDVYRETGFPDEWRLHHQGGSAGYEPREFVATPTSTEQVRVGQAYAWNPSIAGTKSEDTILIGSNSNAIMTEISDWPMLLIAIDGQTIARPAILEIA